MKIVNILGGLGNQMFQYAFAVALQAKHPSEKIKIDSSGFKGYPLHNGFELKRIFDIELPEASIKEQMSLFYPLRNYRMWQIGNKVLPHRASTVYEPEDMHYVPELLLNTDSAYYLGYWQTEKYFRDIRPQILDVFTFPPFPLTSKNNEIVGLLQTKNVVSVHVRRGDYVNIGNTQSICTLEYYHQGIKKMKVTVSPEQFLIFSDDIGWCRENLAAAFGDVPCMYVDWNKGSESFCDIQLMSLCKHNIIANSSFSWWGAWLNQNPDKVVIAPSRWMNNGGWVDIIPSDWVTIQV